MERMPPLAKVFEAWSALADGRVSLDDEERRATVTSSNGLKAYTVAWSEDGGTYSSNDNATYWQGYAGYPVIAALMAHAVTVDQTLALRGLLELYTANTRR